MAKYLKIERSDGKKVRIKKYKVDLVNKTMDIIFDGRSWKSNKEWDNDQVWLENLENFFSEVKKMDPDAVPMFKYQKVQQLGFIRIKLSDEFVDEWEFRKMRCSSGSIHHSHQW
jgi:hypothetical protein